MGHFYSFGIERILLVVGILVSVCIPKIPEEVLAKERRKQYIDFQMYQDARATKKSE